MSACRPRAVVAAALLAGGAPALLAQTPAAPGSGACAAFPATADTSREVVHLALWRPHAEREGPARLTLAGREALQALLEALRPRVTVPAGVALAVTRATPLTNPSGDTTLRDRAVPDPGVRLQFTLHSDGRVADVAREDASALPALDTAVALGLWQAAEAGALRGLSPEIARDSARLTLATRLEAATPSADVARAPLFAIRLPQYAFQPVRASPGNSRPPYPEAARLARAGGEVVVSFVVDTTGRADRATLRVLGTPDHPTFAAVVLREVPRWRFTPAAANGCPVRQRVRQPFVFSFAPR